MDFTFTDEQNLLRDSIARTLSDRYDFDQRRAIIASEAGWSKDMWAAFAELGLLAAPLPEEHGGLGGGPIDVLVIMEEFGKGLVIEPYLQTVVMGAGLLLAAGSDAQKAEHLPAIAAGERILAPAFYEPAGRYALNHVAAAARKDGAGYTLSGHKAVVIGAPMADALIVSARTAGAPRDRDGVSLFLVPRTAPGLVLREYPTVDGFKAADVYLENVQVPGDALLGPADAGLPLIEANMDHAVAALCAEAVGVMRVAHQLTVEYSKTRKQFGQPIGAFQVLQHRMVDMFMAVEQSVSMAYMATLKLSAPPQERARAASSAKVAIAKAARFVGQSAVQIHGGMGVTDETKVSHYFKRLTMIENQFGGYDHHLRRYMALEEAA